MIFTYVIVEYRQKFGNKPENIYLFKVNNRNTRKGCFIVDFEHISDLFLMFLFLTSKK